MAKNNNEVALPMTEPGDLGKKLIELREQVGLSIAQTATTMCLSEATINHLENENFAVLAGPPYIRGYLRNYAKLADVEADDLIKIYESLRGAKPSDLDYHFKPAKELLTHNKKSLSPIIMQLLLLAVLLGALTGLSMIPAVNNWIKQTWNSFSAQTNPQTSNSDNPLLTGAMPNPAPLPEAVSPPKKDVEVEVIAPVINTPKSDPTVSAVSTDEPKVETTPLPEVNVDETQTAPVAPLVTPTPSPVVLGDGVINVKLVFNKEVWMRIRDGNNKTVFEGQNASGQEKELNLKKPLSFRVGNAQGLSLFIDGAAVDISTYTKGSVASFTLD